MMDERPAPAASSAAAANAARSAAAANAASSATATAAERLAARVAAALDRAERLGSAPLAARPAALAAEGMLGLKTRHFYSALCAAPGCRCLQVGVWKGATVFAALAGNTECRVTAVDDWSEFGGPRGEFLGACERVLAPDERARLTLIDGDAFGDGVAAELQRRAKRGAAGDGDGDRGGFDVYIYDGAHDYAAQVYAITRLWRHLARRACVIVVDDWNFDEVRHGTFDGFAAVGAGVGGGGGSDGAGSIGVGNGIVAAFERRTTLDGTHAPLGEARCGWWNGMAAFVIDKALCGSDARADSSLAFQEKPLPAKSK